MPVAEGPSFADRLSEFFAQMSGARKRAMTGMAAAALSLIFVIGGISAFGGSEEPQTSYAARDAEPQVIDVVEAQENENLLKG